MNNYFEYKDRIAFHPGYYIKEIVEESKLTQEDYAKRLDTTPKNLSILIRGEQRLSTEMALKLSRLTNTSVSYWLNIQNKYDTLIAEFESDQILEEEKKIFKNIDYHYFRKYYQLPDLPRKVDEQIIQVRRFLNLASLTVLQGTDMTVSFRKSNSLLTTSNTIKANILVQIAINEALKIEAPKYDKKLFQKVIQNSLNQTIDFNTFYKNLKEDLLKAGVILVVLPNLNGSKMNGACKKIGKNVLLMVNDRNLYSDVFYFTLYHEAGHILNGDFGISLENEIIADDYARDILLPDLTYQEFIKHKKFNTEAIQAYADSISRDPGIIVGRLLNDHIIEYNSPLLKLRTKVDLSMNHREAN